MPIIPQGDVAESLAKETKNSSGSKDQTQDKKLASAQDHKATPGPVMAENLGEPASKEELKKRAEELNKK